MMMVKFELIYPFSKALFILFPGGVALGWVRLDSHDNGLIGGVCWWEIRP